MKNIIELYHYSHKNFKFNKNRKYDVLSNYHDIKPKGLWLSDDNDYGWKEWCIENNFNLKGLSFINKVILNKEKILILNCIEDIKNFNYKYKNDIGKNHLYHLYQINWIKVKQNYHGILISPYNWELRLDFEVKWYYWWDCASACIWDLDAIIQIEELNYEKFS